MKKTIEYTLIFITLFIAMLLISMFIAGNINFFNWKESSRYLVIGFTIAIWAGIIMHKELNK